MPARTPGSEVWIGIPKWASSDPRSCPPLRGVPSLPWFRMPACGPIRVIKPGCNAEKLALAGLGADRLMLCPAGGPGNGTACRPWNPWMAEATALDTFPTAPAHRWQCQGSSAVEQGTHKPLVGGSIPLPGTIGLMVKHLRQKQGWNKCGFRTKVRTPISQR